jgi:hypothetical protein
MRRIAHYLSLALFALVTALPVGAQTDNSGTGSSRYGTGSGLSSSRFGSRNRSSTTTDNPTQTQNDREVRRRDRTRTKNSNQPGTAGAKPTPAPDQKTVKGKKAPEKKAPAAAPGAAPGTVVEFKMKADAMANLLFIESVSLVPTMNITVSEGEKFSTRVMFRNGRKGKFRGADVAIKYDPQVLQPVGIDDSFNRADFAGEPQAKSDARRGIIAYRVNFAHPIEAENYELFRVEWKALEGAEHSPVTFLNTPDFPSRVTNGPDNLLQRLDEAGEAVMSENAGLVDAAVSVTPTASDETGQRAPLGGLRLAQNISRGTAQGDVTLALRPREREVGVGGEFLVDVVYANPRRADIDTMKLKVVFDPTVLQVVDFDEGNWIAKGVNILDGPYHDDLPFDFHMKNLVYNGSGEIYYAMGFSRRERIPNSGVIATIKFRAVAASQQTGIAFDLEEVGRNARTAVTFLGFNLIGAPENRSAAVTNAAVRVN